MSAADGNKGGLVSGFFERSEFDLEEVKLAPGTPVTAGPEVDEKAECTRAGITGGMIGDWFSIEAILGSVELDFRTDEDSDAQQGIAGGVRVGSRFVRASTWGVGGDVSITGNSAQLDFTDPSIGRVDYDLAWVQYDARLGIAYLPSGEAALALAPYAFVGLRVIDGVATSDTVTTVEPEFNATLPYLAAGVTMFVSPESSAPFGIDLQGMLGDVDGIVISAFFTF